MMKKGATTLAALAVASMTMANQDPYLWLEQVEGPNALAWARGMNELSLGELQTHPLFEEIHQRALEILTSDERIAIPTLMGGEVYNFWRDAGHVRGIWRKTTVAEYRGDEPSWDLILDIDALAEAEGKNWVWAGSDCRYPDYDRCLIGLSIGGADAALRREFDLEARKFIDDGFALPESKSRITWRDRDSVFYGPAFSADQMTDSGYPRSVRIWQRGTAPEDSKLVFEGEKGDVAATGVRIWDGDDHYDLIVRSPGFFTRHYYHYDDGELKRIRIPDDAEISGLLNGQLLVQLKSDWQVGGKAFAQGALIAGPMKSFQSDTPQVEVVLQLDERASIAGVSTTESALIVTVLDNVVSRLVGFAHDGKGWHESQLGAPAMGSISVVTADDKSDRFFYNYTGFLTPSTLFEADAMADSHEQVRAEPAWFESEGMEVNQFETTSVDGEIIPYFVVIPPGFEPNGASPTLISAYGGFEVSRTPSYSGLIGSAWLGRGGVYVLANIRGGGEFGPKWHQAALKQNRQRAFDDLIAVSEDVIRRGITSPGHLGIQGGSNGGLLVGAVMVQRGPLQCRGLSGAAAGHAALSRAVGRG